MVVSLANELAKVLNLIPGVNLGQLSNPAPSARSSIPSVPTPSGSTFGGRGMGQINNITISGALDPEGTARSVANYLNSQSARSVTALRDR